MSAFGLDIGTNSIKAVQLEAKGEEFMLLASGITSTPGRGILSDSEKELSTLAEAIKKLVSDAKIASRDVHISLDESQVFTRLLSLPYLSDEEVASAISWQAEPYIPIPISEASLDYQVVRRIEPQTNSQGSVEVLLVAAPKSLINKYVNVCDMAGLTVVAAQSELLALTRSIAPPGSTCLLVDMGANSIDIGVSRSGQLIVSRSIPTAGNVLTRSLATGLGIELLQAEEYKKAYGLDTQNLEGKVKLALEPAFRVIVEEMKKTMQYFKSEIDKDAQISLVLLSGGSAGMPQITTFLAQSLGLEVAIGDPFAQITKDAQTASSLSIWAPLYGISVGLALDI